MQNLDIISVNLWSVLISLLNLLILFLIIKKFLYKPVKKMLAQRQATIDGKFNEAEEARQKALLDKQSYEDKLLSAKKEADSLISSAVDIAHSREEEILSEAKQKAEGIVRQAQQNAELETKKAEKAIKEEIVKVGTLIAEKVIEREVDEKDHKQIIDSFIEEIGEE